MATFGIREDDVGDASDEDDSFFTPLRALAETVSKVEGEAPVAARVNSGSHCERRGASGGLNGWAFNWNWKPTLNKSTSENTKTGESDTETVIAEQPADVQEARSMSTVTSLQVGTSDESHLLSSEVVSRCMSGLKEGDMAQEQQKTDMDCEVFSASTSPGLPDDGEKAMTQSISVPSNEPMVVDAELQERVEAQATDLDSPLETVLDRSFECHGEQQDLVPEMEDVQPHNDAGLGGALECTEMEKVSSENGWEDFAPVIPMVGFRERISQHVEASDAESELESESASVSTASQEAEAYPLACESPTVIPHSLEPDATSLQSPDQLKSDEMVRAATLSDSHSPLPCFKEDHMHAVNGDGAMMSTNDLQNRLAVAESKAQEVVAQLEHEWSLRLMAEDGVSALECALASSRSELAQVRAQTRADASKMLERSSMEYHALEAVRSEQIRRERAEDAFYQVERWMRITVDHVRHLRENEDILQNQIQVLLQQRDQWWDNRWQSNGQQYTPSSRSHFSPQMDSQSPDLRGVLEEVAASARLCNIPIAIPSPQPGAIEGEGGDTSFCSPVPLQLHTPTLQTSSQPLEEDVGRSGGGEEVLRYSQSSSVFLSAASADQFGAEDEESVEVEQAAQIQNGGSSRRAVAEDRQTTTRMQSRFSGQGKYGRQGMKPVQSSTRMGKGLFGTLNSPPC